MKMLEDSYTHNLFFLAQAYGNNGDAAKSSMYCHETLQRQLDAGILGPAAIEWARSSFGLADFYMSMGYFNECALTLGAADFALGNLAKAKEDVNPSVFTKLDARDYSMLVSAETLEESQAELLQRWIRLDASNLAIASDAYKYTLAGLTSPLEEATREKIDLPLSQQGFRGFEKSVALPPISSPIDIRCMEDAKEVFLRAAARIEKAKKYFLLDGFVTEHVALCREHGKLYYSFSAFDPDPKRKLAMLSRRGTFLEPLLKSMNKVAYEVLHKEMSYEIGETYTTMLDIKIDQLKVKQGSTDVNVNLMKASEIQKCNDLSTAAIRMFAHFLSMYAARRGDGSGVVAEADKDCLAPIESISQLVALTRPTFDLSTLPSDEVRPFLYSHFHMARMISKVIPSVALGMGTKEELAHGVSAALKIYDWLRINAPKICQDKEVDLAGTFKEEMGICKDMVELLPQKIDRMHYRGEQFSTLFL